MSAITLNLDPRLVLPSKTWAVTGKTWTLHRASVAYPSQRVVTLSGLTATDDGETFSWTPSVGAHSIAIAASNPAASDSAASTLTAVATATASGRVLLHVGDSLTYGGTYPAYVALHFGAKCTLVGLVTNGGSTHEGHSGWQWATFDAAGSPFFNGAVLDVAAYVASLAATPTHIIWHLGTNDVFNATYTNLDATIATALGHADALIAAFTAEIPTVKHCIVLPPPGSAAIAAFEASYDPPTQDQRAEWHAKQWRCVEQYIAHFDADWIASSHLHVSRSADYPVNNAVHPAAIGYQHLADGVIEWLENHW